MQPARAQRIASQTIRAPTTSPPRIARRACCASPAARRTPRTCSSARASQYFVERGNAADKLNGRNINVSFTNNSNVPIEVMIFIFYSDEIAIDVKTGLVTRHKD
jgi:hypothetical protein